MNNASSFTYTVENEANASQTWMLQYCIIAPMTSFGANVFAIVSVRWSRVIVLPIFPNDMTHCK